MLWTITTKDRSVDTAEDVDGWVGVVVYWINKKHEYLNEI